MKKVVTSIIIMGDIKSHIPQTYTSKQKCSKVRENRKSTIKNMY